MDERAFPVLPYWKEPSAPKASIPWAVIEPHRKQARLNHFQSLERLAERGGLSWPELAAVLCDRPTEPMDRAEARAFVLARVEAFQKQPA